MGNVWDQSVGSHERLEVKKAELFAQRSSTPVTRPELPRAHRSVGRFREFWADRPMLSVAAMFVAPIAALLLFMAVT